MARSRGKAAEPERVTLAVFSSDRELRGQVRLALGDLLADDLPPVIVVDFATAPALVSALGAGGYDCAILDAEATPLGGMGLSHQMRDEMPVTPPIVLLVARPSDAWLATWAKADAVAPLPVDPVTLPEVVAGVIRASRAGLLDTEKLVPGAASRH